MNRQDAKVAKKDGYAMNEKDMTLFDVIPRENNDWANSVESNYSWLNRSGLPEARNIRDLLENWFRRLPEGEGKVDIRQRLHSKDCRQFNGAFFEMFLNELLLRLGYQVEIHPVSHKGKRPDFLVSFDGTPRFYLEATTIGQKDADVSRENTNNYIWGALNNRLTSNEFFLGIDIKKRGGECPPVNELSSDISAWLSNLDYNAIVSSSSAYGEIPKYLWKHGGWEIEVTAIPKKKNASGKGEIVGAFSDATACRWVNPEKDIHRRLRGKVNKYGQLNLPYIIAINVTDFMRGVTRESLENVVVGKRGIRQTLNLEGDVIKSEPFWEKNGLFVRPNEFAHQNTTAVLGVFHLFPSSLNQSTWYLFPHPSPEHPLDAGELIYSLPRGIIDVKSGRVSYLEGATIPEILGPSGNWPYE